jgi:formylglycine-generating enzyme required for sulfatase activity
MRIRLTALIGLGLSLGSSLQAQTPSTTPSTTPSIGMQFKVHGLMWDAHEVTVAQVKRFANSTGFISRAEKEGGGYIYEAGWAVKKGWTWRAPFGIAAQDNEPAVHLTFDEAQKICQHEGKRLPRDTEWVNAAYVEQRSQAPAGFNQGKRYPYPNGQSARESHCLEGCSSAKGTAPAGALWRGTGHVPVFTTRPGVNGLYDMGGNVWEWVDTGNGEERVTRGGSWWYDASRQVADDLATKPKDTRVGYIGFRCVAAH